MGDLGQFCPVMGYFILGLPKASILGSADLE